MSTDINPAVTDYTRTYVLPTPITRSGVTYDVMLFGAVGRVWLLNTLTGQFTAQPNAQRPASASPSYGCTVPDSSASGALLTSQGELLVVGPCALWHLYNPVTDSWRAVESGVVRQKPASLLLPDGWVWVMNGENPALDQAAASNSPQSGNPTQLLLFVRVSLFLCVYLSYVVYFFVLFFVCG